MAADAPGNAAAVSLAIRLHQRDRLDEAEELYRKVLKHAPENVDALHFLGVLHHQHGDHEQALDLIRSALRIDPSYAAARINLGNVLKELGDYEQAAKEYRSAIETDSEAADAFNNLGTILKLQKKTGEAIEAFQRAIELNGQHADAYHNLGNALKSIDRLGDALTAYRKAIEIEPRHTDAHLNLGRALYSFGRVIEAAVVFEKWLEVDPNNPVAEHMFLACHGGDIPERCSDAYVQQSFDSFASSFDDVLDRLEYRAPGLVQEALAASIPTATANLDVLDAGCGTGLCGPLLRPYARRLVGIDLSSKMIERARETNSFDELIVTEITQHMHQQAGAYDAIISADTLVYFGVLDTVFASATKALRTSGLFIFTLERADEQSAPQGYQLNPHGRYSHTANYVESTLANAGLELCSLEFATLRLEVHKPVEGIVVTARK